MLLYYFPLLTDRRLYEYTTSYNPQKWGVFMKIPVLLAGPILRRVSKHQIHIWIATSERMDINGVLFNATFNQKDGYNYKIISEYSKTNTIQLGENLYISLVMLLPETDSFPTNSLLAYNLYFETKSGVMDLGSFDLLMQNNLQSIVYGNHRYPTFFIADSAEHQRLYGSCRKTHGEGEDLFIGADLYMNQHYDNLAKRPSNLFLLGDQIYADDVADPMFSVVHELAEKIMGNWQENLSHIDKRLEKEPFDDALHQLQGRQYISEKFCKFTSNNAGNHLFTFGEYAAMYILNWSPEVWKETKIPTFEELREEDKIYFIYKDINHNEEERIKELEEHELRYRKQVEMIEQFQKGVYCARRIMANTPTYMMFDDHDITDDWNLSENWRSLVQTSPLGSHVIANGLTAYWAFQGWGNDPTAFDQEFLDRTSAYFMALEDQIPLVNETIYKEWNQNMWSFDSWFYIVPTKPESLFLDTRTMRHFTTAPQPVKIGRKIEETPNSPELIRGEAWERITNLLQSSNWDKKEPLFIISPVPLYGIDLIESVLLQYVEPLRSFGIPVHYQFDMEAWKFNGKGFHTFMEHLEEWGGDNYFILSGDTHLASNVHSKIEYQRKRKFNIHQFTSSPIKNMSFSGFFGVLLKSAIWFNALRKKKKIFYRSCNQDYHLLESKKELVNTKGVRWKETIQYKSTDNGNVVETDNNIGIVTISSNEISNTLLTYNGKKWFERAFSSNSV